MLPGPGAEVGGQVPGKPRPGGMEESMEEEEMLTYEAMMDDQNHNNWEAAADSFRQPPPAPPLPPPPPRPSSSMPDPGRELPGGQLLAVHAGSMERKGPKEGLPMGPPPLPEPNGVIMMLEEQSNHIRGVRRVLLGASVRHRMEEEGERREEGGREEEEGGRRSSLPPCFPESYRQTVISALTSVRNRRTVR